jgi:inorganic pyrophosphatase
MNNYEVIIETPKGSITKYTYKPEYKVFQLKKLLPAGMCFPYDFGFIPGTKGEDGDPLDALVISEFKTFPGCMMDCRLIGAIQVKQSEKGKQIRNDRFFFVPEISIEFEKLKSINDVPEELYTQLIAFFRQYNDLEEKTFRVLKKTGAREASAILSKGYKT